MTTRIPTSCPPTAVCRYRSQSDDPIVPRAGDQYRLVSGNSLARENAKMEKLTWRTSSVRWHLCLKQRRKHRKWGFNDWKVRKIKPPICWKRGGSHTSSSKVRHTFIFYFLFLSPQRNFLSAYQCPTPRYRRTWWVVLQLTVIKCGENVSERWWKLIEVTEKNNCNIC